MPHSRAGGSAARPVTTRACDQPPAVDMDDLDDLGPRRPRRHGVTASHA